MGQLDGAARSDLVADIYGIAREKQPCPLNYLRRLGDPSLHSSDVFQIF